MRTRVHRIDSPRHPRTRRSGLYRAALTLCIAMGGTVITMWSTPLAIPAMSPWKTTTVLYRHQENARHIIAQQMRDTGATGYRRRIVRSYEIGPVFRWDAHVMEAEYHELTPPTADLGPEWRWVSESRNPFGWKGG